MINRQTIGQLFNNPPATWGLRGDPYLWQAMQQHFSATQLPVNSDGLVEQIKKAFNLLTQHSIDENEFIVVKEFSHGGMSSGGVVPRFWREKAIPLLVARFEFKQP